MSNISALETSPEFKIQPVTEIMLEVFNELRANRPKTLECRDIKSSLAHGRCKSMPNMAVQNSAGDALETGWSSTTDIMFEVFDELQTNRQKSLECRDLKSFQAHGRCKSMPNMAVRTNSAGDVPDIELPSVASMELQVSTDTPSTELSVTTPAAAEVSVIEAPSNISSYSPKVQPVEADALQSSPMYNMAALQFGGAESKNCSTKPPVRQANSIQDIMVTCGGRGDVGTNPMVPAVIPKRRSLWSRTKRFVRRMLCCGAIGIDRNV